MREIWYMKVLYLKVVLLLGGKWLAFRLVVD